jgi:transcriptional regulator with XRE-family HTH domain
MGARLRAARELLGASTREVAQAAGLSRRELEAIERGAKHLSTDQLHALADALDVDPAVLGAGGFDGELAPAGTIGDAISHHRDGSPPARPVNPRGPERRQDHVTRQRIEDSWQEMRHEMGDALASCARLISAGSGDDVRYLIEQLEHDLQQLKSRHVFQRNLADHELALLKVRGTGGNVPHQSLASSTRNGR